MKFMSGDSVSSSRVPKRARVIGSDPLHVLLLPDVPQLFSSVEFIHLSRDQSCEFNQQDSFEDGLTIVVNPDDFCEALLVGLSEPLLLWFLRPLCSMEPNGETAKSPLGALVGDILERRRDYVLNLQPNVSLVVVPDSHSEAWLRSLGVNAVVSPPAIRAKNAIDIVPPRFSAPLFYIARGGCAELEGLFLDELSAGNAAQNVTNEIVKASHIICLGDAISGEFMIQLAFGIVMGKTAISTKTSPTWGLEPGLDFIEVSTPAELFRVVEYITRNPEITSLMNNRSQAKRQVFATETVFSRILSYI